MAIIKVVFGSVNGNAQQLAEDAVEQLKAAGHQAELLRHPEVAQLAGDCSEVLLVITSTTGQGDIPPNLLPLYEQLNDQFPLMPEKPYGVVALGDSSYEDFAEAGRSFDFLLKDLKARRVIPTLFIDACETLDPEEEVAQWLDQWQALLD